MRDVGAWERLNLWLEEVSEPLVRSFEARFERAQAWRARVDARVDATAAGSFGLWLRYFAVAVMVTAVVVAVLQLLLVLTVGSESWQRWSGVVVVGLVALVLEVTVLRNVVISIAEPSQRRSLLIAFLTSVAVLLISVEAFAAATAAIAGGQADLWPAERLYVWHLVDSVPLLAIPQRLEWTEPELLTDLGGRLLVLGFKIAVIAPLVRLAVAFYELVESESGQLRQAVLRASAGSRTSISLFGAIKGPRTGLIIPVIVVAGLAYGGLGPDTEAGRRIESLSAAVQVGALLLVAVVALALAVGVAALTVMAVKRWWWIVEDLPEGIALVVAVGLVWLDAPIQIAPLPDLAGHTFSKFDTTIVIWVVALAVLAVVGGSEPELPETSLALGLVLMFAGPNAFGQDFVTTHVHWTPWGFATGDAIVAAGIGLTGAYLVYLMSLVPARVRGAGRINALNANDAVRAQLVGYFFNCVQIVIAAAALLLLLQQFDIVSPAPGPARLPAEDALIAVTWHVLDALPGPDIPDVLGWRLTSDFTGRWAGLVIIIAIIATLIVVAFPMARAIVQWAKLKAAQPRSDHASADLPAAVLHNLEEVVDYLITRPRDEWKVPRSPELEQRLIDVELARRALLDLLGSDAPMYEAVDRAIDDTAEAYRTAVTRHSRWHRHRVELRSSIDRTFPRREESEARARAALDAYRPLVQRWQTAVEPLTDAEPSTAGQVGENRRTRDISRRPVRYGYARVSTRERNPTAQYEKLVAASIAAENIVIERFSGTVSPWAQLDSLLDKLLPGDELVITRLRRLAGNQQHLSDLSAWFDANDIDFIVLEQGIDTSTLIGRVFVRMMAALAVFDREVAVPVRRRGRPPARATAGGAPSRRRLPRRLRSRAGR